MFGWRRPGAHARNGGLLGADGYRATPLDWIERTSWDWFSNESRRVWMVEPDPDRPPYHLDRQIVIRASVQGQGASAI